MAQRLRRRAVTPRPRLRSDRAAHLPRVPDRSRTRAALEHLRAVVARVQHRRLPAPLRDPARAERPAVQPDRHGERAAGAVVQHRGQLRHQHQLAELRRREHAEPPHPDGGPHGPAIRVRRRRHGGDGRADPRALHAPGKRTIGNFWVDLIRTTLRILLPHRVRVRDRADRHRRDPEHARVHRRCTPLPARRRRSPAGRTRAWSRSSSSAPTAATSSTSTPRTRSRTRPSSSDFLELYAILHHPVRARVHVRAHGQGQAPGLRGVRDHGRALARRSASRRRSSSRAATRSSTRGGVTQTVTATSPGGNAEGKEVRFGPVGVRALGRVDDGHVERLRQLDARQLHAARRHGHASCT